MSDKKIFAPIRGKEASILAKYPTCVDGNIYFATDSGKIFLDAGNSRIQLGNTGIGLFYANVANPTENTESESGTSYILALDDITNSENLHENDLILNTANGSFYRVDEFTNESTVYCTRLSVSGGGGGGSSSLARGMSLKAVQEVVHGSIINGQTANAIVTVKSDTDDDGAPQNDKISVQWSIAVTGSSVAYVSGSFVADHGVPFTFEYGTRLRENASSTITFQSTDSNGKIYKKAFTVSTIELSLTESTTFSKTTLYNSSTDFKLSCNIKGQIQKILYFYVDDVEVDQQILSAGTAGTITSKAISLEHGAHKATIKLYSYDNNIIGEGPDPLEFEFAYIETGNTTPIVWLGSFKPEYYSYDKIQIPYLAYDPANAPSATVNFYKGSELLEAKTTTLDWNDISGFSLVEITDATVDAQNLYTIICGSTSKNIVFQCTTDPNRDMSILSDGLLCKFDAAGRSNSESSTNRQSWKYDYVSETVSQNNRTYTGEFTGFNWYNNGWVLDDNNNTCLRISNGAEFAVDLGSMTVNTDTAGAKACTFEFEFKIKNIQNYSKVLKENTLYNAVTTTVTTNAQGQEVVNTVKVSDQAAYAAFRAQTAIENYDTFLTSPCTDTSAPHYSEVANPTNIQAYIGKDFTYDDLQIRGIDKVTDTTAAFAKYYDTIGLCLGSQDGFFTDGTDTVNVKYVEDKIVNLSVVFDYTAKLIIFYLNGVMSSVSKITPTGAINLTATKLIFASKYCDIDLYKFRVYNKALNLKQIGINYSVDHRDILVYDQNDWLPQPNASIGGEYQLSYDQMLYYNEQHPDDFLMPYMILDTTNATTANGGLGAGILPYRKAIKTNGVHVTFVNTALEHAYATGQLGTLAEEAGYVDKKDADGKVTSSAIEQYYMHHCPSWTSRWPSVNDGATAETVAASVQAGSAINLAVQGTSSEFYPRRNFKIKTKGLDKNNEEYTYMFMNRGPFADTYKTKPKSTQLKWFYVDNDYVGTNKFTLKIDFMESSGTYNMGLANFVKQAYTKHPLNDYVNAHAMCKEKVTYSAATEYDAEKTYYAATTADGKTTYAKVEDQSTVTSANVTSYFLENKSYDEDFTFSAKELDALRTSVQGFPVLMFHKNGDSIVFIGRYNMLIDKGSDEEYGFKTDKKCLSRYIEGHPTMRNVAECWEFSDNSRTWCSYNDPLGRSTLSFDYPAAATTSNPSSDKSAAQKLNEPETNGEPGAPYVANSFEYRYHKDADMLDYLYDTTSGGVSLVTHDGKQCIKKNSDPDIDDSYKEYSVEKYGDLTVQANRNTLFFNIYKNWEKACQWLYSCRIDNQPTENSYTVATVADADAFAAGTFYKKTSEVVYEEAKKTDGSRATFDPLATYFQKITETDSATGITSVSYEYIALTAETYANNYNGDGTVNSVNTTIYYLQNATGYVKATTYVAGEEYYTKDTIPSQYALSTPVTIGNTTYTYDTKEYRLAKFKNELKDHFDLEYCLVYFVITEVLMLYDSRGKNCMMASWGPLKQNGDYIWYPVFYDMDTQLGINNTGIPSFEYYVNATEEGCYSTNDSVLWTNLYKAYFSEIKAKYFQLRGQNGGIVNVNTGITYTPFKGKSSTSINESIDEIDAAVAHIENWYLADPDECGSMVMQGTRPLAALNLDEYYKYISITNPKVGYQLRDGSYDTDGGTYFYALQGNRSLSRQQFLANRINFIDSWMNFGEYARGGSAIFGRIGANNAKDTNNNKVYSDYWLNYTSGHTEGEVIDGDFVYGKYYLDNGEKAHKLDADVTVTLKPFQNSYVAIGGDNGITASEQYNGTALKLDLPASVVEGRLNSASYGEQLFYIYGTKSLQDIGDMSTLYWTEFYATKSPRLQRILLGSNYPGFFNKSMNYPNLDAGSDSTYGKPLLKEVNLDHIQLTDEANKYTFDFTTAEKMTHFEAIGPEVNITGVTFAAGVALDTLYLPSTLTELKLTEARKLTDLIKTEPLPTTVDEYNSWNPENHKGLYVAGLTDLIDTEILSTDNARYSNIGTYAIAGGNLKYGSYQMLKTLFQLKRTAAASTNAKRTLAISLTDVCWTPYVQLVDGDIYSSTKTYVVDNHHYGLESYTSYSPTTWNENIKNGDLYVLDTTLNSSKNLITDIDMFQLLKEEKNFTNTNSTVNTAIPIISGVIYIDNTTAIEESSLRNGLLEWYPNMKIFVKNITPAHSARFVNINDETGAVVELITQKVSVDDEATWFKVNPYNTTYQALTTKNHWDFKGWSTTKPVYDSDGKSTNTIITESAWNSLAFSSTEAETYTYYAIYERESYVVTFKDGNGNTFATQNVVYGEFPTMPLGKPPINESALGLYEGYKFHGYKLEGASGYTTVTSYPITSTTTFVAGYDLVEDIRTIVDDTPWTFTPASYSGSDTDYAVASGYEICVKPEYALSGKVVIPVTHADANGNELPVISLAAYAFAGQSGAGLIAQNEVTHVFFATTGTCLMRSFGSNAFKGCEKLKYVEMPASLRMINEYCFASCKALTLNSLGENTFFIGSYAFNGAYADGQSIDLTVSGSLTSIGNGALSYINGTYTTITIGTQTKPTTMVPASFGNSALAQNQPIGKLIIYCSTETYDAWDTYITNNDISNKFKVSSTDNIRFPLQGDSID